MNELNFPWKYVVVVDGDIKMFSETRRQAVNEMNYRLHDFPSDIPHSVYVAKIEFYNGEMVK